MTCIVLKKMIAPKILIDSKTWCPLNFLFEINNFTIMGIRDKNMKNSIKSENCPKSKTLRELEALDWYIVIKPSVPCSVRKGSSEKMSVDSIQRQPPQPTCSPITDGATRRLQLPQLTLKLSI